jgi:hypothetical protein
MRKIYHFMTLWIITGLILSVLGNIGAEQLKDLSSAEKNISNVSPMLAQSFDQVVVDWVEPTTGVSIAVDAIDNVYTVYYDYNLGEEITLTKRDMNGNLLWEASYDQTDPTKWEKATWVAIDNENNIVVSGTLMSGYSNPVNAASILMKFGPAGNLLWRQIYESSFDGSYTKKCLIDADNNIYVLGMGSGPTGYVTKIKKFTPNGSALWSYFDADGIGAPINFKFTPEGNIVVVGRAIYGSVNGYAKIDLDGNNIWSYPEVYSLTVGDASGDAFGNTYLVHGEYVSNPGTMIKKIDQSGELIWENVYALSGLRIEIGTDNCAVVSGYPNPGTFGAAFIKVDGTGNLLWANLDADGPLALMLHAQMILDGSNDAYLAAGTLFEMAVCKVNNDGTSDWTQTMSGSYANAIALGNNENSIFVVGGYTARLIWNMTVNSPPYEPNNPNPSDNSSGFDVNGDISWTGGDPDTGDIVTYDVYFGTMSPPPLAVTNITEENHNPGTMSYNTSYYWKIVSRDEFGLSAPGPIWQFTTSTMSNIAPDPPEISGPATGIPGKNYTYQFSSTDPEDQNLYYYVDWGDNTTINWDGPYDSGEQVSVVHTWNMKGTYTIKVKVKDVLGAESEWATLAVKMPLSIEPSFFRFFELLFERFPNAFPILRYILDFNHWQSLSY